MKILDRLICELDHALRTIAAPANAVRASPAVAAIEGIAATDDEKVEAARLMRVNHCGELCAQALYRGQALVAQSDEIRTVLEAAAQEERDHLAWCQERIEELGGRTSILNPAWYAASFCLGVASGALGDKWSMGFLVETERQVERHLEDHLGALPESDNRSRSILSGMLQDEIRHGDSGEAHGAAPLPRTVKGAMKLTSKLMTRFTYWV
jgi:ubiquinone biosynthesis monooxygenase Coq7